MCSVGIDSFVRSRRSTAPATLLLLLMLMLFEFAASGAAFVGGGRGFGDGYGRSGAEAVVLAWRGGDPLRVAGCAVVVIVGAALRVVQLNPRAFLVVNPVALREGVAQEPGHHWHEVAPRHPAICIAIHVRLHM